MGLMNNSFTFWKQIYIILVITFFKTNGIIFFATIRFFINLLTKLGGSS